MYNIMNQVKEDLDYFKTYDYVIKADVVKIIVTRPAAMLASGEDTLVGLAEAV